MDPARKLPDSQTPKIALGEMARMLRRRKKLREELLRSLFTPEFLKLPERVKRLGEELKGLSRAFQSFVRKEFQPLKRKVDHLDARVGRLEGDVHTLKQDVGQLKQDVAQLKQDVAQLKQDVAQLKQDVAQLKQDVAQLKGSDFERTVRERAPAYFGRIVKRCRLIPFEELASVLEDAVEAGAIEEEEKNEALLLDAVVRGRLKNGREVLLAVEVSLTVDREDVQRAARRAEVLNRAFSLETIGVACGKERTQGAESLAEELLVVLCP